MIASLELPATLPTRIGDLTLRRAQHEDLDTLMRLLADDPISAGRGDQAAAADVDRYDAALTDLIKDPSNEMLLVISGTGDPMATMQLTRIPGLTRRGSTRLLIEAVRVSSAQRSSGIGSAMMTWVVDVAAPATGASLVQLTSDDARGDAHRFYERLGFVASHRGFKYQLAAPPTSA
ncbi:GNAT family N-acetyltransferase [Nesterenkonia aurantiaca]|uniref:GNAT family N-acetyltransferase n=1 Tax=Nesterenkonia aurantiaca TaxID=1436010 RepID=UPI003EE5213C